MADNVNTAIGLFQFAIDTLGYIQLAREFKDDFETHQLKLDIIQLRLSRWGEIANITQIDSLSKSSNENPSNLTSIMRILEEIHDRLCKARREAEKVQKKLDGSSASTLDPETCIPQDLAKTRARFKIFLNKRKAQMSKAHEGLKWVFYKKEHFDKFVANISELIDGLESIMPEGEREKLRLLSNEECKGISKANLEDLKDIVEGSGCDPWLESSVEEELNGRVVGTVINQSGNTGSTVGIHNGDNKGISYGAKSRQNNTFS
ncbi:2446437b-6329-45ae-acbe-11b282087930-CDS [Sclerotinia trifoliorum]|uniref:2446437b-6329-45ae-acbe-11b282087930-CDS n=1 Tax=Sclerotinia trifoliorum TaxID=28548 RepID=A0A8H2VZG2_9HELO|nr:2446437b-6329-45ae-acbe-11b282087930-CDS [Sclerotinia trifoliorum]